MRLGLCSFLNDNNILIYGSKSRKKRELLFDIDLIATGEHDLTFYISRPNDLSLRKFKLQMV